jgi:hypothetical protein
VAKVKKISYTWFNTDEIGIENTKPAMSERDFPQPQI